MEKYIIYTDGGASGNPGKAAIGILIYKLKQNKKILIKEYSKPLEGIKTNNEAEYEALIFALNKLKQLIGKKNIKNSAIEINSDSQLLVKQLNRKYKIENQNIIPLFIKTWNLLVEFPKVKIINIPREKNKLADSLVKKSLNQAKLL
jgi:ribonuclease HI